MAPLRFALALGFALLPAGQARAAALPFHATLTIDLNGVATTIEGTGTAVSDGPIGGSFDLLAIPQSVVATAGRFVDVTDPANAPIQGAILTVHNPAGTFVRSAGGTLGGTLPLAGIYKVCLFEPCSAAIANLAVPLSPLGSPVNVATTNLPLGGQYTVHGAPWTTGTVMLATFFTYMGTAHGPASGTSTTFSPGGRVQLVVPVRMVSLMAVVPIVATLTIDFVPEPATGVLLGGGIAVLVGAARRGR